MAAVDDDADADHLLDERDAEAAQARIGPLGAAVGDEVLLVVGEQRVADAERMVGLDHRQAFVKRHGFLEVEPDGELPRPHGLADLRHRRAEREPVAALEDRAAHLGDVARRLADQPVAVRHRQRDELDAEAPHLREDDVDVVRVRGRDPGEGHVPDEALLEEFLRLRRRFEPPVRLPLLGCNRHGPSVLSGRREACSGAGKRTMIAAVFRAPAWRANEGERHVRRAILGLLGLGLAAALPTAGVAQTLTIGVRVPPTSFDPQLSGLSSDLGYNLNIYDNLFVTNALTLQPEPHLATGYKLIDDLTWEIKLRPGVKFHNGAEFGAEDVVFSFKRLGTVPGSDNLIANYGSPVKRVEVIDKLTVRLHTDKPAPDLIPRLIFIPMLCQCIDPKSTTEDFNTGKAAIGAGPYKFVEWKRGDRAVLQRHDDYWKGKPDFERVVLREMPNDPGRVAALQAGDVDAIDFVPPLDVKRLQQSQNLAVYSTPSGRVMFVNPYQLKETHPLITDAAGNPLGKNPFDDVRVRQALKAAISQDIIVEKVMDGLATKATQGVPKGFFGHDPSIQPAKFDPAAAKKLLAEAGYPNGFGVQLSCPNDRWVNDGAVCQALGQMWTQVGIRTKVEAMPKSVYFKRMLDYDFPLYLAAWGNNNGQSTSFLTDVFGTRSKEKNRGSWNASYSSPELDAMLDRAITIMDEKEREKALQEVMKKTTEEVIYIPLHAANVIIATKANLVATPRADEATVAWMIKKK